MVGFKLKSMESGDHIIVWETDPLIFLQIFRGHPECGRLALAVVVDRTVWKQGIVVLFDSMLVCFPNTLEMLEEWLAGSPLTVEGCKWITANMPHQGSNTSDCGVWMCCMATFYIRGLLEHDLLVNSGKVHEKMISRVSVVSRKDATEVGGDGRKHIMDTIKTSECKLDVPVFDSLVIAIH
jgi:Ulp1 family protease